MTLQERYRRGLEAHGYRLVKETGKYLVFAHSSKQTNIYLGRAGAVRVGGSVVASVPISDKGKAIILAWGEGA